MNNGKICVSVCAETADEVIAKIKLAESLADVIEVRFDCLNGDQIEPLVKILKSEKILLATFRSPRQDDRIKFWQLVGNEFPAFDLEEDIFELINTQAQKMVSFHDFTSGTNDLDSIYQRLSKQAKIIKIAVHANDAFGAIDVWHLLEKAKTDNKEIISIAMGEAGKWTRILGLAHGAYMTYASLDEGDETADGQITIKDLSEVYRVKELDKSTAVYGVIGDPVASSKSPYMHNAAFAANGINAVFLPMLVKDIDEFIRRMVSHETREVELNFAGFSVTMPHKQSIIKHLDEIDATAKKIGAVNTVKIVDDKLIGYNTDAHGFITPLKAKFGELKNARVAVLGAGGAARACVYALTQEGADVTAFARDLQKANSFAEEFNVNAKQFSLVDSFDIIVNTTPLGMKGAFENDSPLTAVQLEGVKFVYDLVTRADETPLLCEAKKAGIPAIGGLEMLIAQGVKQFEIWTGSDAPAELMRRSVTVRLAK